MMPMMYLIDDSEIKSTDADFLMQSEYRSCVCVIRDEQQLAMHRNHLVDADCIMVHKTFCSSNKAYQDMETYASEDGRAIPFVAFSAGDNETAVYNEGQDPLSISGLRKAVFYERLQSFIDYFRTSGTVNLKILAYGNDYQKVLVRTWAVNILRVIVGKTGKMNLEDLSAIANCSTSKQQSDFKQLMDAANINYADLLEALEDDPITYSHFRTNINNIVNSFNQYGKNICTWK